MTPRKLYQSDSVHQAALQRLDVVFREFDNIYVSFSGGKDSGLLLHLCMDYMRRNGIKRKIGVFHQDFEAQYSATTKYVTQVLTNPENLELIEPYWLCIPMRCKTATSMFEQYWTPWDADKRDIWVRDRPDYPGVIHQDNHQLDFWHPQILQEEVYRQFAPWLHQRKRASKTICLVGIRADESLNRFRAIAAPKGTYQGLPWTTQIADGVWSGYPIYDWAVDDIWTANARYAYPYNQLYDLFHHAGLSVHEMRVASPFNDWAIGSLNLYRVIEPSVWARMVGRVNGANFCAIYGGTDAVAWKNIKLPKGHTWRSYVDFLLRTLPEDTRKTYEEKFSTSIEFWRTRGGVLSAETIQELRSMGIPLQVRGKTNYRTDKQAVTFSDYPDDADVREFATVPSYKRMAICILKNDHLCKYMGFSQTKKEAERRQAAIAKYADL